VSRLKVAFLTEFFYPHVGGCETRYLEIGRRLVSRGHEVHVFTIQYDNNLAKEEQVDGIQVHRYAYSKKYVSEDGFRSFNGILKYSMATLNRLRNSNFDIYYANQWPMLHSIFAKPVIYPLVQEWCEVWDNLLKAKIMQRLLKNVGKYNVAVSEFTQDRLIKIIKIAPEKTVLIPNGVDASRFYSTKEKVRGRIIYAGRIVPHKHVELLVEAFREVKMKIPEAELHIIGSGISLEAIKMQSADIKDCFIYGFLPEDQMIEMLKSSWLFVLPSEREGSGIAAMEAMAAGIPFVTVNYPNNASKDLCELNCGLVVEPTDSAIAEAIIQLYNNETLWKKLSENALNVAKKYDWDMITNQMEAFFGMVVNNSEK
jgi:glycosyltransferase involved in cell wall biosynthesis